MKDKSEVLIATIESLRPFVEKFSKVEFDGDILFESCLRSSFVKAFTLLDLVIRQDSEDTFFLVPALRSITEDIIFLVFLSRSPLEDRESVIRNLIRIDMHERLKQQQSFFKKFRPFQQILTPAGTDSTELDKAKQELCEFWKNNGWKNYKKWDPPPVREMAQKSSITLLEFAYDFIYRLVSGSVHFQTGWLFRSGWGGASNEVTFSPKNMSTYYSTVIQVYGSCLLCLYFELFDGFLNPSQDENKSISNLREHILTLHRWPEIVTFEEMNIAVPQYDGYPDFLFRALYCVLMAEGFVSGAEKLPDLDE